MLLKIRKRGTEWAAPALRALERRSSFRVNEKRAPSFTKCLFVDKSRKKAAWGEDLTGEAPARGLMSEPPRNVTTIERSTMSTTITPTQRPKTVGETVSTVAVRPGFWRVHRGQSLIVGHVREVLDMNGIRYRALRFHAASGEFVQVGDFWERADAVDCLIR